MPDAAAAAHDHAGTACVLLGLSSASGSGDEPIASHGNSSSRSSSSNGEVPSRPIHGERPSATLAAAAGEEDDLATGGKRRTQMAALPRKEWSLVEDDLIRHGVQRLGCKWRVIAAQLPGRSDDAVRNRWSRLQESMRVPEQRVPPKPIGAASLAVPSTGGAAGSSASDWAVRQSPVRLERKSVAEKKERVSWDKKERTSWTRAEDDIIVQCVAELGHKWFEIARRLPARTDHAIRNRWSRLQSILGLNDAEGSGPAGEPGASTARAHEVGGSNAPYLSRSDSDLGGRSDIGGRSLLGGRSDLGGSLERRGEAGQAAKAMLGAVRAAAGGSWPQQSYDAPLPHTRVLAEVRRGTNAPPPSPQLAPTAGAISFPVAGSLPGDHYGGCAFELLHKLGSHNSSAHASPALNPSPGGVLPGSEQLTALPPGALPEGSAELLLLKKARVT